MSTQNKAGLGSLMNSMCHFQLDSLFLELLGRLTRGRFERTLISLFVVFVVGQRRIRVIGGGRWSLLPRPLQLVGRHIWQVDS